MSLVRPCQTSSLSHLLLGVPEGVEVGQQGVPAELVLLPEIHAGLSSQEVPHTHSSSRSHFNAVKRGKATLQSEKNRRLGVSPAGGGVNIKIQEAEKQVAKAPVARTHFHQQVQDQGLKVVRDIW